MGEDLFEKFDDKKEEKKKMGKDKDVLELRIRLPIKKIWLERAIFIVIILILIVLVFYNPFGKYRCEKSLSEIKSEPVAKTEENQTTKTELEKEPEEPIVEEEPETEPEPEQESAKELSGKITLEIVNIELYENNTKVKSILVKIDNQKKIFTPTLYVYWYDEATEEAVKTKPNGGIINYTGAIPVGIVKSWKLDEELLNRRLRTDDQDKETFKIELYDSKDPVVPIDTKTKTITVPS